MASSRASSIQDPFARSWGAEIVDVLKPRSEDIVSRHHGHRLGGFLTNWCVESTMRTGHEKGYKVVTLTDYTARTEPGRATARR